MSDAHICQGSEGVGCWCDWCSSILGLKSHACFTLPNSFLRGLVDTRPEDTTTCKQLCFGNALVWLVWFWWGDNEGFSMEHKSIFNSEWFIGVVSRDIVGMELPWCSWASQRWWCQPGHASQHPSQKPAGGLPFREGTGGHGGWQYPMQSQGQVCDWNVRLYQGQPFSYQGGSKEHNHTLAGIGACTAAGKVYLQGSFWVIDSSGLWSDSMLEGLP